jgi:hypothetical protein
VKLIRMTCAVACVPLLAFAAALPLAAQQTAQDTMARAAADTTVRRTAALDSAALGTLRGADAARYESTTGWVMRGFAGGLTLGPIGAGLAWTVANNSEVALSPQQRMLLLQEGGSTYTESFQRAYAETLLTRRKRSALTGGAIGTAALAAVVTTVWAVYYYY